MCVALPAEPLLAAVRIREELTPARLWEAGGDFHRSEPSSVPSRGARLASELRSFCLQQEPGRAAGLTLRPVSKEAAFLHGTQ